MNHHFGNTGDVLKHLLLGEMLGGCEVDGYAETHAGSFDYPLAGGYRSPDDAQAFLDALTAGSPLEDTRYVQVLRQAVASERPAYPGSARIAAEVLGPSLRSMLLCDLDSESCASLRERLRGWEGVSVRESDGIDVVYEADLGRSLVMIDPFRPAEQSPVHGLTAHDLFGDLARRRTTVVLWEAVTDEPGVGASEATWRCTVEFVQPVKAMRGFVVSVANVPQAVADRLSEVGQAWASTLTNARALMDSAPGGGAARVRDVPGSPGGAMTATDRLVALTATTEE